MENQLSQMSKQYRDQADKRLAPEDFNIVFDMRKGCEFFSSWINTYASFGPRLGSTLPLVPEPYKYDADQEVIEQTAVDFMNEKEAVQPDECSRIHRKAEVPELKKSVYDLRHGATWPIQPDQAMHDERFRTPTLETYKRPAFIPDEMAEMFPMDTFFPWTENFPTKDLRRFKWLFRCTYYTYVRGLFNLEGLLLREEPLSGEAMLSATILAFSDLVDRNILFLPHHILRIGGPNSGNPRTIDATVLPKRHWSYRRLQFWPILFDQPQGRRTKKGKADCGHWVGVLVDLGMENPTFWYFDTVSEDRDTRMQQVIRMFAGLFHDYGWGHTFRGQAHWEVAPCPDQQVEWECGLLVLEGVRQTLLCCVLNTNYTPKSWNWAQAEPRGSDDVLHGDVSLISSGWVLAIRAALHRRGEKFGPLRVGRPIGARYQGTPMISWDMARRDSFIAQTPNCNHEDAELTVGEKDGINVLRGMGKDMFFVDHLATNPTVQRLRSPEALSRPVVHAWAGPSRSQRQRHGSAMSMSSQDRPDQQRSDYVSVDRSLSDDFEAMSVSRKGKEVARPLPSIEEVMQASEQSDQLMADDDDFDPFPLDNSPGVWRDINRMGSSSLSPSAGPSSRPGRPAVSSPRPTSSPRAATASPAHSPAGSNVSDRPAQASQRGRGRGRATATPREPTRRQPSRQAKEPEPEQPPPRPTSEDWRALREFPTYSSDMVHPEVLLPPAIEGWPGWRVYTAARDRALGNEPLVPPSEVREKLSRGRGKK